MAVTKEQPFPQALAGIAAPFQNAEPASRALGTNDPGGLPGITLEDAKGA